MIKDFVNFVREQGIVGLAVGLAIGIAASDTVSKIVDGFIDPIVGFILGGKDLSSMSWTILTWGDRVLTIWWGAIASSLITLLATAFVIYFLVQKAGLDKLDNKKQNK